MRDPNTHKGDYGHALLIAGSHGRVGCAVLAARAALRSGCGVVTVHVPSKCVDPVQSMVPEAIVSIDTHKARWGNVPENLEFYDAIAVGPGIDTSDATVEALGDLLQAMPSGTRLILDADALNIMALRPQYFDLIHTILPPVITPHDGEYRRLFGIEETGKMAREHNMVIVRKGHHSRVYGPDGSVYTNLTGNAGMATAGSGDVLTGILLGLSAKNQQYPFETACLGVKIHGESGDLAVERQNEESLIAGDLVEYLKYVTHDLGPGEPGK